MHIRRRHQHHLGLEQGVEQPPENHGIGNVGDVQFIETKQPGAARKRARDLWDRIARHSLARCADEVVHFTHEGMKMQASSRLEFGGRVEQVHEHGLAAPDGTKNVAPLGRRRGPIEEPG